MDYVRGTPLTRLKDNNWFVCDLWFARANNFIGSSMCVRVCLHVATKPFPRYEIQSGPMYNNLYTRSNKMYSASTMYTYA